MEKESSRGSRHTAAFKSYWSWNDMAKDHERNYFNVYTLSTLGFSDSAFSDICSYVSQVLSYRVIFTFSQPRGVELTPTKWNAMAFFPSFSNAGGVKVQRTSHKQQNHTVGGKKMGRREWLDEPSMADWTGQHIWTKLNFSVEIMLQQWRSEENIDSNKTEF